jgi:type II secretory pathway component GspD/PulD (secretin)
MIAVCSHVPDQLVSLDVGEGRSLQECLKELVAGRGLVVFQKNRNFYLVSCGNSSCPSFMEVADSQRIYLKYINAKGLISSLPKPIQSYVSVGERTNEVFVYAAPDVMENIKNIIKILDIPQQQIVLEVLVVELWDSASDEFGLDWGIQNDHLDVSMTEGLGYFTGLAKYTSVPQNAMSGVMLTLRSLVSKERADIRARPRVATLNGQSASIDISLDEYFTIVTDAYGPNALLRTELQVIKSGIMLNITPNIGEKDDITVDVITEVSDVAERQNQIQGNESGNLPLVKRRKVDTNVRVKDGDAIIIGGLVETQQKSVDKRVPVLSSIPLVGGLFTAKENQTVNKEVVIFITPRIMQEGKTPFADRNSKINVSQELQQLRDTPPTVKDEISWADLNEAAGKYFLQKQPYAALDESQEHTNPGNVPSQYQ